MKKPVVVIAMLIGFVALLIYAWWLAVVLALIAGGIIYLGEQQRRAHDSYQQLVLYTLRHRAGPEESRANQKLAKVHFQKSQLIRNLQIIHDCIYLTRTSKKVDVIRGRLEVMENLYRETKGQFASLMTDATQSVVFSEIAAAIRSGHTNLYANPASAALDKAKSLKTKPAVLRHIENARAIITEGKANPEVNHSVLDALARDADALETTHV